MSEQPTEDSDKDVIADVLSYCVDHCLDLEEDEDDPVLSMQDLMEEEQRLMETARVVLGSQDDKCCSWPEGYKPRQAIFVCLTCTPETSDTRAGVCFGCSIHCHDGHDIAELYTKRNFRCDCGTSKFATKCMLYEEKTALNERNKYNVNFTGRFCKCLRMYPDPSFTEEMMQCNICENWFHPSHISMSDDDKARAMKDYELVCDDCAFSLPFLRLLSEGADETCASKKMVSSEKHYLLMPYKWRDHLCRCSQCMNMYEDCDCSYLLDPEDTIEEYERQSEEKTKAEREEEEKDVIDVNAISREHGPEAAIRIVQGVNEVKEALKRFFTSLEPGSVITSEQVKSFFEQAKRRRFNEDEPKGDWD